MTKDIEKKIEVTLQVDKHIQTVEMNENTSSILFWRMKDSA